MNQYPRQVQTENNPYAAPHTMPVGAEDMGTRSQFLSRTYNHLFGAILLFVGLEFVLFKTGIAETLYGLVARGGNFGWLAILGVFGVAGWFASRTAMNSVSPAAQYAALGGYVLAEALLIAPMLFMAAMMEARLFGSVSVIGSAAMITLTAFGLLTGLVWVTKKDFSFLGVFIKWVAIVAVVAIVTSLIFGFELGVWFSAAMVLLAGGMILYTTSNILHHYPKDRHVSAALELFAAVALLFWYVLRLVMSFASSD